MAKRKQQSRFDNMMAIFVELGAHIVTVPALGVDITVLPRLTKRGQQRLFAATRAMTLLERSGGAVARGDRAGRVCGWHKGTE